MSSVEYREGDEPPQGHKQEQRIYQRAARFRGEQKAWRAYQKTQRLIAESRVNISAYRFQLARAWRVAVVAETPPDTDFQAQIAAALSRGKSAELPSEVHELLLIRHRQIMGSGLSWFERHCVRGKSLSWPL